MKGDSSRNGFLKSWISSTCTEPGAFGSSCMQLLNKGCSVQGSCDVVCKWDASLPSTDRSKVCKEPHELTHSLISTSKPWSFWFKYTNYISIDHLSILLPRIPAYLLLHLIHQGFPFLWATEAMQHEWTAETKCTWNQPSHAFLANAERKAWQNVWVRLKIEYNQFRWLYIYIITIFPTEIVTNGGNIFRQTRFWLWQMIDFSWLMRRTWKLRSQKFGCALTLHLLLLLFQICEFTAFPLAPHIPGTSCAF